MTDQVQHQVDQIVLEQGEYLPLELLLYTGRLSFSDYEAWRFGELRRLDEALFGDVERVRVQLRAAETYLERRGWQAEAITYMPWPGADVPARALRFSADEALDGCFHRRYRPPPDRPQLDLFTDAPAASLVNAVTRALAERDTPEARRGVERLYEVAPDHARLGELERLVEAAEDLHTPVEDPAGELERLEQALGPLAESLLGRNARNLTVLLWRRLSGAVEGRPYRGAEPRLHVSYTAARSMDWDLVRAAVERETHWRNEPMLLHRHARACESGGERAAALESWFALCWRFPEHTDALEESTDGELRRLWSDFLALDPELPPAAFPAWLLLQKPGLTRLLPNAEDSPVGPESYLIVNRLLRRQAGGPGRGRDDARATDEQTMAWRASLKKQDPVLFQHYVESLDAKR